MDLVIMSSDIPESDVYSQLKRNGCLHSSIFALDQDGLDRRVYIEVNKEGEDYTPEFTVMQRIQAPGEKWSRVEVPICGFYVATPDDSKTLEYEMYRSVRYMKDRVFTQFEAVPLRHTVLDVEPLDLVRNNGDFKALVQLTPTYKCDLRPTEFLEFHNEASYQFKNTAQAFKDVWEAAYLAFPQYRDISEDPDAQFKLETVQTGATHLFTILSYTRLKGLHKQDVTLFNSEHGRGIVDLLAQLFLTAQGSRFLQQIAERYRKDKGFSTKTWVRDISTIS